MRKQRKLLKGATHEKMPLTHVSQEAAQMLLNRIQQLWGVLMSNLQVVPANGSKVEPPRPLEGEPRMAQHTLAMTFIRKKN